VSVPRGAGQPARELHLHRVGDQLELERPSKINPRPMSVPAQVSLFESNRFGSVLGPLLPSCSSWN
jgi:hypothetical protein